MDTISEQRLAQVHPTLATKIRAMSVALTAQGIAIRVVQGLRTWDEQASLYAQGRTAPGKIVTNAPAGSSYHNYGLAVDVVPMTPLGPDWNVNHPVWRKIVTAGQDQGLVPGAPWRTFPDWPHFQMTGSLPLSPNEYVKSAYVEDGLEGVWAAGGMSVPDAT
jgi:peptidoglycan L-alanyl-D-glutamate endopeptidase CwlK